MLFRERVTQMELFKQHAKALQEAVTLVKQGMSSTTTQATLCFITWSSQMIYMSHHLLKQRHHLSHLNKHYEKDQGHEVP